MCFICAEHKTRPTFYLSSKNKWLVVGLKFTQSPTSFLGLASDTLNSSLTGTPSSWKLRNLQKKTSPTRKKNIIQQSTWALNVTKLCTAQDAGLFLFFYLEFVDRQYLKNTGYCHTSGDDNWDSIYWSYLSLDHHEYKIQLEKVLDNVGIIKLENQDYFKPIQPYKIDNYVKDANFSFFGWIQSCFLFDPVWGRWWRTGPAFLEEDVQDIKFKNFW